MLGAISAGLGLASTLLGGKGGGGGGGGAAPQAPGFGFNPGQMAALANLQQYSQGPYQQSPGAGPLGSDLYGFQGSEPGMRLPGAAIGPQLSQAPGGMYGDHQPGGMYDLRTPVPVDQAPGGLLDDPNPNMADRFKQLGGMVSEGPRGQYLQPPAAPGIGGGTGFDITPYMRRGIRPVR